MHDEVLQSLEQTLPELKETCIELDEYLTHMFGRPYHKNKQLYDEVEASFKKLIAHNSASETLPL